MVENGYWMWCLYSKKTFAIYSQGKSLCETLMRIRRASLTDCECSVLTSASTLAHTRQENSIVTACKNGRSIHLYAP